MTEPAIKSRNFLLKAVPGTAIENMPRDLILYKQGKRGNAVFYVVEGIIALTVVSQGKERIISLLGPGSLTGEECVASTHPPSSTSARTLTNCAVLRIDRNEMLRLVKSEETLAAWFLDYLFGRIGRYQDVIMDHLCEPADKRLAQTLLLLANFGANGEKETVVPFISQDELADVIGTTRARTCHFMNRFRNLGFVAYEKQGPLSIRTAKLSKWLNAQQPVPVPLLAKAAGAG